MQYKPKTTFRGISHDYDNGFVLLFEVEVVDTLNNDACEHYAPILLWVESGKPRGDFLTLQYGLGPGAIVTIPQESAVDKWYSSMFNMYHDSYFDYDNAYDLTDSGKAHVLEGMQLIFAAGYLFIDERGCLGINTEL